MTHPKSAQETAALGRNLAEETPTQELSMYKRIAEHFGKPDFKEGVPRREISEPGLA
jgi:hypothetical protein